MFTPCPLSIHRSQEKLLVGLLQRNDICDKCLDVPIHRFFHKIVLHPISHLQPLIAVLNLLGCPSRLPLLLLPPLLLLVQTQELGSWLIFLSGTALLAHLVIFLLELRKLRVILSERDLLVYLSSQKLISLNLMWVSLINPSQSLSGHLGHRATFKTEFLTLLKHRHILTNCVLLPRLLLHAALSVLRLQF